MFDFAWSEILLIGAVALIAIGPKDMPAAIRTVSAMIKKARRMAAEFQTHVDEMVREADLGDVKKAFNDIRNARPEPVRSKSTSIRTARSATPSRTTRSSRLIRPPPRFRHWRRSRSAKNPWRWRPSPNPSNQPSRSPPRSSRLAWCRPRRWPRQPAPAAAPAFIPPEAVLQRNADSGKT